VDVLHVAVRAQLEADDEFVADGDRAGDGTVTATDEHPFWITSPAHWVAADKLTAGQRLLAADGAELTILSVHVYQAVATVYNLTVDDIHTYFAEAGGLPVLVHNRPDQDSLLVYHYTDKKGYNGIRSGSPHQIRQGSAKHGKGPFVTPRSPRSLAPKEYKSRLGLTRAKSEYVIAFRVNKNQLGGIEGARKAHVWTLPGTTNVPRGDVEYIGPTDACPL